MVTLEIYVFSYGNVMDIFCVTTLKNCKIDISQLRINLEAFN